MKTMSQASRKYEGAAHKRGSKLSFLQADPRLLKQNIWLVVSLKYLDKLCGVLF